jgi:peptidoglycan/LPS O-acetylase OafA/YrhL
MDAQHFLPPYNRGTHVTPNRISELDGLRGVASLFVLFHHAFSTQLFWAWIWMEMFFVLSGFLITTILLRTDIRQPIAIRNFLIRRGLRIWPVYYVGLLAAMGIWALYQWHNPSAYPDVIWWKFFFYLQFTEGYSTVDLSYMQNYAQWFRPSWSLAVEEQYYLLWPLLIVMVGGRRALMLAFCVAVIGVCLYMRATGHALNLLLTRGDGFALGSALAVLQEMTRWRGPAFRSALVLSCRVALLAGLAVILPYIFMGHATGVVRVYGDIAQYGNWTVNVLAAAALFFGVIGLMSNGHLRPLQRWMSWRPLTYLGEVSYAVYMFQSLVFVVIHQLTRSYGELERIGFDLLAIAISIALGPLSYRFLEQPLNRLKRYFPVVTRHGTTQDAISDMPQSDASSGHDGKQG